MHDTISLPKTLTHARSRAKSESRREDLNTAAQDFSILLFYTICAFYSQTRPKAAKEETNKTIVVIGGINDFKS